MLATIIGGLAEKLDGIPLFIAAATRRLVWGGTPAPCSYLGSTSSSGLNCAGSNGESLPQMTFDNFSHHLLYQEEWWTLLSMVCFIKIKDWRQLVGWALNCKTTTIEFWFKYTFIFTRSDTSQVHHQLIDRLHDSELIRSCICSSKDCIVQHIYSLACSIVVDVWFVYLIMW